MAEKNTVTVSFKMSERDYLDYKAALIEKSRQESKRILVAHDLRRYMEETAKQFGTWNKDKD